MKKWEKNMEREKYNFQHKIPSFSSSLLDEIYRSIDEGEKPINDTKLYRETAPLKKQIKTRASEDEEMANLRRACLLQKWVEHKKKLDIYRKQELYRKSHLDYEHDRDVLFFSSTSISSESSSGGFSSSDTESIFSTRSCFAKPIRTKTPSRTSELKKMKQPLSPGARIASFLNSMLKKTKNSPAPEKKSLAGEELACSGSSFARSCLSKQSEKMGNGVKRTVRFCPDKVINGEENGSGLMAVSIPTAWKIGKAEERDTKPQVRERSKKVEEEVREFLKMKKNLSCRELKAHKEFEEEEDDDDASSCSSSDLFELDHLEMIGRRRYNQELPVYETTRAEKNRAIAKSLLMQKS